MNYMNIQKDNQVKLVVQCKKKMKNTITTKKTRHHKKAQTETLELKI